MKKILLISLFVFFLLENTHALTMKPPSLLVQMSRQERVNRDARIFEMKMNNQMKLRELRARNKWEKATTAPQKLVQSYKWGEFSSSNQTNISNVDMSKVRNAWFSWYNDYRSTLNLWKYNHDPRLDKTAHDWNIIFSAEKWQNHHRRSAGDSYYDFPVIDTWFIDRGINPIVINRSKHTENVGYGYYSCSSSDCTDELITSIRSTFNFFMSEKGRSYDAHYRSIINPYFTKMGFDIIIVPSEKRYYITVHFITE